MWEAGGMADIFISYAHEDQARAQQLAHALETQGWSVSWDRQIPAGSIWRDFIGQELNDAKSVVVLWSAASAASHQVYDEADEARKRNVLIPLSIEAKVQPPMGFRQIHMLDFSRWRGSSQAPEFDELIAALIKFVDIPSPQTRERIKGVTDKRQIDKEVNSHFERRNFIHLYVSSAIQTAFWVWIILIYTEIVSNDFELSRFILVLFAISLNSFFMAYLSYRQQLFSGVLAGFSFFLFILIYVVWTAFAGNPPSGFIISYAMAFQIFALWFWFRAIPKRMRERL